MIGGCADDGMAARWKGRVGWIVDSMFVRVVVWSEKSRTLAGVKLCILASTSRTTSQNISKSFLSNNSVKRVNKCKSWLYFFLFKDAKFCDWNIQ